MQITFSKLLDGFRLYNEAANRSRQTIRWYNYHLRGFLAWLEINYPRRLPFARKHCFCFCWTQVPASPKRLT